MKTAEQLMLLQVIEFVASRRRQTRRGGPPGMAGIAHPFDVATALRQIGQMDDLVTLAAGLLHDAFTAPRASLKDIDCGFGEKICSVVLELTDQEHLPEDDHLQHRIEKATGMSPPARIVALVDALCHVQELAASPRNGWPHERRLGYRALVRQLLDRIRGTHPALERRLNESLDKKNAMGTAHLKTVGQLKADPVARATAAAPSEPCYVGLQDRHHPTEPFRHFLPAAAVRSLPRILPELTVEETAPLSDERFRDAVWWCTCSSHTGPYEPPRDQVLSATEIRRRLDQGLCVSPQSGALASHADTARRVLTALHIDPPPENRWWWCSISRPKNDKGGAQVVIPTEDLVRFAAAGFGIEILGGPHATRSEADDEADAAWEAPGGD